MYREIRVDKDSRQWISVQDGKPEDNVIVETKIDDHNGLRNEQKLKRIGNLWFTPDGQTYVYYSPTHWRYSY